jgi:hypothetical protein
MRKTTTDAASAQNQNPGAADAFRATPFYAALRRALATRGMSPEQLCDLNNAAARRLLAEYGAMFLADESVRVPPVCVFRGEDEVVRFQREAEPQAAALGDAVVELQPAALDALLAAREEARAAGSDITPRDGAEGARRGYEDTLRLWRSRVYPALDYWAGAGRLDSDEATRLRALAPDAQLSEVLGLEAGGIFFSRDFSKSILYSVAAPGASQHLAMLAFDAVEFKEARVRSLLARRGWFQTVLSDLPHFTFLGVREKDLPDLGLKRVEECGQIFWVPNLG